LPSDFDGVATPLFGAAMPDIFAQNLNIFDPNQLKISFLLLQD